MFGFLKRSTKEVKRAAEPQETLNRYQTESYHAQRRDVQLLLHANAVFPGAIDTEGNDWTRVTFYPSNHHYRDAAAKLRDLQRRGLLTIEEPLQPAGYSGWTAKVRLND